MRCGRYCSSIRNRPGRSIQRNAWRSKGDGHYPQNPDELVEQGWEETTHPDNHSGNRDFVNPKTGEKIHYDKGVSGANGFKGKDHYHRYNPNSTDNSDLYLDRYGNSTPKGSKLSHILPK